MTAGPSVPAGPAATAGPVERYAADRCRAAAKEIGHRLAQLRSHVTGLDPERLGLPTARYDALLASYDVYARMLDDALADIASVLCDGPDAPATAVIADTAAQVTAELAALQRVLAPVEQSWARTGAQLGPKDEWNIAADGLFGPAGVLGTIARALDVRWPEYGDVVWPADCATRHP